MSTRKNAGYNVAYRLFSVLLPLVIAPYLSRTVGTDGVGLYSKAWSISYIFCLIGKSACGKDTVYRKLLKDPRLDLTRLVTSTTRPIREGEQDGCWPTEPKISCRPSCPAAL